MNCSVDARRGFVDAIIPRLRRAPRLPTVLREFESVYPEGVSSRARFSQASRGLQVEICPYSKNSTFRALEARTKLPNMLYGNIIRPDNGRLILTSKTINENGHLKPQRIRALTNCSSGWPLSFADQVVDFAPVVVVVEVGA